MEKINIISDYTGLIKEQKDKNMHKEECIGKLKRQIDEKIIIIKQD